MECGLPFASTLSAGPGLLVLHWVASHRESRGFGLAAADRERAFQVGSGSWWSFFQES